MSIKPPANCVVCQTKLGSFSSFSYHLMASTGCRVRQFSCRICSKSFIWPATLLRHTKELHADSNSSSGNTSGSNSAGGNGEDSETTPQLKFHLQQPLLKSLQQHRVNSHNSEHQDKPTEPILSTPQHQTQLQQQPQQQTLPQETMPQQTMSHQTVPQPTVSQTPLPQQSLPQQTLSQSMSQTLSQTLSQSMAQTLSQTMAQTLAQTLSQTLQSQSQSAQIQSQPQQSQQQPMQPQLQQNKSLQVQLVQPQQQVLTQPKQLQSPPQQQQLSQQLSLQLTQQQPQVQLPVSQKDWCYCEFCHKAFLNHTGLALHMKKFHAEMMQNRSPSQLYEFGSPLESGQKKRGRKPGTRVCKMCKKTFQGTDNLLLHLQHCHQDMEDEIMYEEQHAFSDHLISALQAGPLHPPMPPNMVNAMMPFQSIPSSRPQISIPQPPPPSMTITAITLDNNPGTAIPVMYSHEDDDEDEFDDDDEIEEPEVEMQEGDGVVHISHQGEDFEDGDDEEEDEDRAAEENEMIDDGISRVDS